MKGEWNEVRLGDYITDIAAGPFGSNLKVECFVPSGFPIIDGANLKSFKVTDNVTKFVTEEKARSLHRSIAKRHDVIVTISGTVGQISYIPTESKYEEYLCSQRQFRATFDESKVDVSFLVYYFHSRMGQQKILSFANQVGVPALAQPLKNFREIRLSLPPLPIQRRIAAVLGALDDKIELNRKMNANLEAQAQALFKSWFVDFAPWGGKMPAGWKRTTLGNVCDKVTDGSHNSPQNCDDSEIPMLSVKDMQEFGFDYTGAKHISRADYLVLKQNSCVPEVDDVLVAKDGSYLKSIFIVNEFKEQGLLSSIAIFRPNLEHVYPEFLLYLLKNPVVIHDVKNKYVSGSGVPRIVLKDFKTYPIVAPALIDQKEFHDMVLPFRKKIQKNMEESRKLAELRDALLPKLMSGELEVA